MNPAYTYNATCVAVHDGDTATFDLDLGFDVHAIHPLRFYGLNAPELNTPDGKTARDYLLKVLPVGSPVVVQTSRDQWDKYGRYLGTVTVTGSDYGTVNDLLISTGHAKPWDGRGSKPT